MPMPRHAPASRSKRAPSARLVPLQDATNAASAINAHAEAKTAAEKAALAPAAAAATKARAEHGLLWECAGLASGLINNAAKLHFTRHIPTLVAAYTWFSSAFALRFTLAVRRVARLRLLRSFARPSPAATCRRCAR